MKNRVRAIRFNGYFCGGNVYVFHRGLNVGWFARMFINIYKMFVEIIYPCGARKI
jgi:hypothetical protein